MFSKIPYFLLQKYPNNKKRKNDFALIFAQTRLKQDYLSQKVIKQAKRGLLHSI